MTRPPDWVAALVCMALVALAAGAILRLWPAITP